MGAGGGHEARRAARRRAQGDGNPPCRLRGTSPQAVRRCRAAQAGDRGPRPEPEGSAGTRWCCRRERLWSSGPPRGPSGPPRRQHCGRDLPSGPRLRPARDGREHPAGDAARRVDREDRGGGSVSGSEEGKAHELVIIRRRANSDEGGHHGGVWKIAYADFMTAMMAFFLVMWLINSTDKKTLTQVATYFNPLRLTDKRPAPKGLHEPDGSESTQTAPATGKGAKPKEGKGKGTTKRDESEVGEVRARGEEFKRGNDAQKQAPEAGVGGDPDYSARDATGRAYCDPFDAVPRSEIMPGEPASGRAEEKSDSPSTSQPFARQSAGEAPERSSKDNDGQPAKGVARESRDGAEAGKAAKEGAKAAKDGEMAAGDGAAVA